MSELMENKGVIRNHGKIGAAAQNIRIVLKAQEEFDSLSEYFQSSFDGKIIGSSYRSQEEVLTINSLSDELTKDLKRGGFKFTESTAIYVFLKAIGTINDYFDNCSRKEETICIGKK